MVILRPVEDQKVKMLNIFHSVTRMLTVFLHYDKLSLLTAYNSTQHYIICISETYLDTSIDENILKLDSYSLIRADQLGFVCIIKKIYY